MFWGKVRRQFIITFMKKYIKRQLRRRQGHCLQCSVCCNFSYPCIFLTKERQCRIYHTTRPRVCTLFPINQSDIDDVAYCGGKCGYWFE
jgi:hypothetical protein